MYQAAIESRSDLGFPYIPRSASSLCDASSKRSVFEAELPAEGECALLDL